MQKTSKTPIAHLSAAIFLTAFLLNFVYENLHTPLYLHNPPLNFFQHLPLVIYCSFGDALYILLYYLFVGILSKNTRWIVRPEARHLAVMMLLGFLTAIIVEKHALTTGRWGYQEFMPIVPVLDIGLTPFIQLALLGPLTCLIAAKMFSDKQNSDITRSHDPQN